MAFLPFGNIKCEALDVEGYELPSPCYKPESFPSGCYFSAGPAEQSYYDVPFPQNYPYNEVMTGGTGLKTEQPYFPHKNVTRDIFNFFARKQFKNEPFGKFFADLKSLAKRCELGDQEERLLKAQIVLGVESESLQTRLSREDISLERIVLHCVSDEVAQRKRQQIQSLEPVEMNPLQSSHGPALEYSTSGQVNESNNESFKIPQQASNLTLLENSLGKENWNGYYDLPPVKCEALDPEVPVSEIEPELNSARQDNVSGQPDFPFPGNFLLVDVKTEDFGFESFQPKEDFHPPAEFPFQDEYLRAFQPSTSLPEVEEASYNQATELVQQYVANMSVVSKPHACLLCGKAFSRKENLARHYLIKHTEEKPYACSQCGKQFTLKAHMERHQLTHLRMKIYRCPVCDKAFSQKTHLERHQLTHIELNTFNCLECPKVFSRRENLQRHQQVHLKVKRFKCGVCERPFTRKDQMLFHQATHSEVKPYECPECGKRFARKDCFLVHKKKHSEVRRFFCDECGKSFSRKDNLIAHQRTHSDYKPFSCLECGKSFSRETNLTRHRRLHSEVRLYKCSRCEKSFSRKEHLVGHELLHSEVKPYDCSECGRAFARKEHLVKHQKSIHAVNVMNLVDIVLKNEGL